jgi:hypothetical protein
LWQVGVSGVAKTLPVLATPSSSFLSIASASIGLIEPTKLAPISSVASSIASKLARIYAPSTLRVVRLLSTVGFK